jgi:hypothetical protein
MLPLVFCYCSFENHSTLDFYNNFSLRFYSSALSFCLILYSVLTATYIYYWLAWPDVASAVLLVTLIRILATPSQFMFIKDRAMLNGSLVTTAWYVLTLRMEDIASRGLLLICCGPLTRCSMLCRGLDLSGSCKYSNGLQGCMKVDTFLNHLSKY